MSAEIKDSIMEMANGAFKERVNYEMGRVVDNILDLNTKATAKRKIVVTMEIVPTEDRRQFNINVTAKPSLAVTNPITTSCCIAGDETGEVCVVEMTAQVPGQVSMDGEVQVEPKIVKLMRQG